MTPNNYKLRTISALVYLYVAVYLLCCSSNSPSCCVLGQY